MAYDLTSAPVDISTSAYQESISQISHFGTGLEVAQSDGDAHASLHSTEGQNADWMHSVLSNALPRPTARTLAPPESEEWYRHSAWLSSCYDRTNIVEQGAKATMVPVQSRPASSAERNSHPTQIETILQRRLRARYGDEFPYRASTPHAPAADAGCFTTSLLAHSQNDELEKRLEGVPHVGLQYHLNETFKLENASQLQQPQQQPSTHEHREQESHTSTGSQSSTTTRRTKRRHRHCNGKSISNTSIYGSSPTNDCSAGTKSSASTKGDVEAKHIDDFGTTRYFCPDKGCDKHFSTSGHARRHGRKHEGLMPFECPHHDCCATFTRRDNCTQHQRILHTHHKLAYRLHATSPAALVS